MNKHIITGLTCGLLFFVAACSNNSPGNETHTQEDLIPVKEPGAYCFVYCDFTRSMDQKAHEKVIADAMKIYDSLNKECSLFYFTVGNNPFREPLFSCSFNEEHLMTPQKRTKMSQARRNQRDTLLRRLQEARIRESSLTTCIIDNIRQSAQNCLNINESGDGDFRIVFLSDMLENCGDISIQRGQYKRAEESIAKLKITEDFKKFSNLRIAVVVSSSKGDGNEKLGNFWTNVFEKFRYNGPRIRLSAMIPWEKLRSHSVGIR